MKIESAEYAAAFDAMHALTEVFEAHLRHVSLYLETVAIDDGTSSRYFTLVSQITTFDVSRVACSGIDSKYLSPLEHHVHDKIADVHAFYAAYFEMQQAEIVP